MLALFIYVTLMQRVPKYMVSLGKAGPRLGETTRRESSMLYVSWCLDKTKFFVAVPKREPLNLLCIVGWLSSPRGGLVLVEAHLLVLTRWSSEGSAPSMLTLLAVGEEELPAGGWQAANGLRNVGAQPQVAGVWYAESKSNGNSWGEFFSADRTNKSVVHGADDEVFSLVERWTQI